MNCPVKHNINHVFTAAKPWPSQKVVRKTTLANTHNKTYIRSGIKKFRLRETKHLSTDADSITDTTNGWIKNTKKPEFFEKRKKSFKTQKLKNV